jgi:hypothetical protein
MERFLLLLFKMKYLELSKVDTFIGSMLFSTSLEGIVHMKLLVSMGIPQELFNIGSIDFSPMVLQGCGIEIAQDVPANFLSQNRKSCEMKYDVLQGNWHTTKTYGMAHCYPVTLKSIMGLHSVSDNVKGFSINLDLHYRDLVRKPTKQTLYSKRNLKKLLPMDERSNYSTLGRGRSPFSKTQQFNTDVVSQGTTTTCNLCLNSSENRLFWSNQPENRTPFNSKIFHI